MYMTAVSNCKDDNFSVAFAHFASEQIPPGNITHVSGPDGWSGPVKHVWLGQTLTDPADPTGKTLNVRIAVQRLSDGKFVTPKGVKPDGSFDDITATKRPACLLFELGSKPLTFAPFRAGLTADGIRIIRDNFYDNYVEGKMPWQTPEGSIPCEEYADVPQHGDKQPDSAVENPMSGKVGRMVDTYNPGGCLFAVDDCSS